MVISATVQEIKWVTQLLEELEVKEVKPVELYCDNQAAIAISNNDVHHGRTKHIDIKHHYTRDTVKEKLVHLQWISNNEQLADIFTKPLSTQGFKRFREAVSQIESI